MREDVAVFWDLDTCPIPRSTSGYELVEKVRLLSQQLGVVKSFRGYADLTCFGLSRSLHLRSELQSSGVSLIDCPTTEHRSIASKTMIVDMLTHAVDNSPPSTLLVIAGNNDFAYAISILRLRRYDVVLVCPKALVGEHSQASVYLDWFNDILGYTPPDLDDGSLQLPLPPRRPRSNSDSTTTSNPPIAGPSQDRSTPSPKQIDSSTAPDHRPRTSISRQTYGNLEPVEIVDAWEEQERLSAIKLVSPSPPTTPAFSNTQDKQDEMSTSAHPPIIPVISLGVQRPSSAPPSYSSFSPAPSPSSDDLFTHMTSQPFNAPEFVDDPSFSDLMDNKSAESNQPISQPQSPGDTSTNTITPRDVVFGDNAETVPDNRASSDPFTQQDFPSSPARMKSPSPALSTGSSSSSKAMPATPQPSATPIPEQQISPLTLSSPSAAPVTSVLFHPPTPSIIPDHFIPLIIKLQVCRSEGNLQPWRPGFAANFVSTHGDELKKVDAPTFTKYAQLAEQAGIVELPAPGDTSQWIALRPELYEYALE
ncbi:hypothetical protein NP233_g3048 [Leucocoprinus birnbaumii]|uniref:NYN domain-containing protein n=1 Tax=Leucocoprinus birnbaumii TaxID=56174 RepID=A0AAD5W126_9AGAR|nr:hypothetical protein NP233_g3048 [Leucocoprinus birnbaumii]